MQLHALVVAYRDAERRYEEAIQQTQKTKRENQEMAAQIREMAEAFGDPEAAGVITLMAEETVETFEGYTHLCGVYEAGWSPEDIQISLRRE